MSFQNESMRMPRDAGCLTDGEMGFDNSSRIKSKRGHQWLVNSCEPELFGNKKQALEAVNDRPIPGMSNVSVPLWGNTSCFQSGPTHFTDRLFGPGIIDRNTPSTGDMNIERKGFENQFGNDSSVGLSMSHTMEDPTSRLNHGGFRKVKVNQVREYENGMSISLNHTYNGGDSSSISMGTYNSGDYTGVSTGPRYSKADDHFVSMGHTSNKADGNFISIGHTYNKGAESILSMAQPFDKGNCDFISMGQPSNNNMMSMSYPYEKGPENFISIAPVYNKNEHFISMGSAYDKVGNNVISMGPPYDNGKRDSNILSMGHNYSDSEAHTISFGGFQDEREMKSSGKTIVNYDLVMNQSSGQASEEVGQKDFAQLNSDSDISKASLTTSRTHIGNKSKEVKASKNTPPNNFPSNVKSLLSTGMLDGVPVKYVSWSREKNLRGVIKGTGYLCGCKDCKLSKSLNAYEFERHAGCKTKHPNNHIYFENGKTIYAVVQELKSTPQEMLFEAIQNITGSPINQKNFHLWKASYQAATRELQRIYGKDDMVMPS